MFYGVSAATYLKQQDNVRNLFKFNNKGNKTTSVTSSSVVIINFEQIS